jgi:N-acetylneuraminic acid mutarotase
MPTVGAATANVVNGKIYLISGSTVSEYTNGTFNKVYDPETDTWTTKTPMPAAASGASTVFDGKIYFVGGCFSEQAIDLISTTQVYDPETDAWSIGTTSPTFFMTGSAEATLGLLAPKRIYIFDEPYGVTAFTPNDPLYKTQVYDPEENSWVPGATMPSDRKGFGVAVLNDTFYVIGGYIKTGVKKGITIDEPIYEDSVANEQYLPIGYGTPDPSYEDSSALPAQTPSSTPAPTPIPTTTPNPSSSIIQQPAGQVENAENLIFEIGLGVVVAFVVTVVVGVSVFVLKRRPKQ